MVRPINRPFKLRPEAFDGVGVDGAARILFAPVVHGIMLEAKAFCVAVGRMHETLHVVKGYSPTLLRQLLVDITTASEPLPCCFKGAEWDEIYEIRDMIPTVQTPDNREEKQTEFL